MKKSAWLIIIVIMWLIGGAWPTAIDGQTPLQTTPVATPDPVYLPLLARHACPANEPLPVPLLQTPGSDDLIPAGQPVTFQWSPGDDCAGAVHYSLQIATDPAFNPSSIVYGVGLRAYGDSYQGQPYAAPSHQLPAAAPGVYFWRVAAHLNQDSSGWSEPRRLIGLDIPAGQLLANGSFEDHPADPAPWQWLSPEVSSRIPYDADLAPAGQQVLAANRQDNAFGNKSFFQDVAAYGAGTTYHFSIWVRASTAAVNAAKPRTGRIALWAFGDATTREHSTSNFQVQDTRWRCVETSLTVAQAGHTTVRAEVYLTALDNLDVYFDYATLRADGRPTCPAQPPPQSSPLVSHGQGFDTCAAPPASHLAAWKQASPYEYVGIYLGGANHYQPCRQYNQQYQTAAWFAAVSQQGWRFIPIWVGPQAPCTAYAVRLSANPDQARSEGVGEARQALAAAANLGLLSAAKPGTIIYYDMEYYPTGDAACHNAVNAFLAGWVSELQNQGHQAGIYGSAQVVNGWYTLWHVPDSVWAPWYIGSGYDPGMNVDVLNQRWITPSYWPNHRLFQYSNSHNETWGGATLNIDNNTARGLVALETDQGAIRDMALLTPDEGWLRSDNQLLWTDSGGARWRDITPPQAGQLEAVFFLRAQHGWVLTSGANQTAEFVLWQTTTGGNRWQAQPFTLPDSSLTPSSASLDFVTPETGWVALELASSGSFSRGRLFKTVDGGKSWRELNLPTGGDIRFFDEDFGWLVGGPTRSELYVTRDGGQSWQAQEIGSPAEMGQYAVYQLPVFSNAAEGATAVTVWQDERARLKLYTTGDGGQSWQLANRQEISRPLAFGATLPVEMLDGRRWVVASDNLIPGVDITALDFATSAAGWAIAADPGSGGAKQPRLYQTKDAGETWTILPAP